MCLFQLLMSQYNMVLVLSVVLSMIYNPFLLPISSAISYDFEVKIFLKRYCPLVVSKTIED